MSLHERFLLGGNGPTSHNQPGRLGQRLSGYSCMPFHHMEAEQKSLEYMETTYNFNVLDEIIKLICEYLGKMEEA